MGDQLQKHKLPFMQDKGLVFSHLNRLIRCTIDCQIHLKDAVAVRNALELARSFGARVWDSSPLQMKQIDSIGVVAVRKLVAAGINNFEALEAAEAYRIDTILSKNPPFGTRLLEKLRGFPKLMVTAKMTGKVGHEIRCDDNNAVPVDNLTGNQTWEAGKSQFQSRDRIHER